MIGLIRKQQIKLSFLIDSLSKKQKLDSDDLELYDRLTREVEFNLKSIRKSLKS